MEMSQSICAEVGTQTACYHEEILFTTDSFSQCHLLLQLS